MDKKQATYYVTILNAWINGDKLLYRSIMSDTEEQGWLLVDKNHELNMNINQYKVPPEQQDFWLNIYSTRIIGYTSKSKAVRAAEKYKGNPIQVALHVKENILNG